MVQRKILRKSQQGISPPSSARRDFGSQPIRDEVIAAIGRGMPATRQQARIGMALSERHRKPFLESLSAALKAVAKEPAAGIHYHSWEGEPKPRVAKKALSNDHPVRNIFTPFSTLSPKFMLKEDCGTLINFSFHLDRRGRVTLFPGSSGELVRAFEILNGWGTPP